MTDATTAFVMQSDEGMNGPPTAPRMTSFAENTDHRGRLGTASLLLSPRDRERTLFGLTPVYRTIYVKREMGEFE